MFLHLSRKSVYIKLTFPNPSIFINESVSWLSLWNVKKLYSDSISLFHLGGFGMLWNFSLIYYHQIIILKLCNSSSKIYSDFIMYCNCSCQDLFLCLTEFRSPLVFFFLIPWLLYAWIHYFGSSLHCRVLCWRQSAHAIYLGEFALTCNLSSLHSAHPQWIRLSRVDSYCPISQEIHKEARTQFYAFIMKNLVPSRPRHWCSLVSVLCLNRKLTQQVKF